MNEKIRLSKWNVFNLFSFDFLTLSSISPAVIYHQRIFLTFIHFNLLKMIKHFHASCINDETHGDITAKKDFKRQGADALFDWSIIFLWTVTCSTLHNVLWRYILWWCSEAGISSTISIVWLLRFYWIFLYSNTKIYKNVSR